MDKEKWHCSTCPDIMDLIQATPAVTDCEKGFNVMNMVKTDWRSRLDVDTLSDLLLVQLTSPDIPECDPHPAVKLSPL